jgi:hypothetical protein
MKGVDRTMSERNVWDLVNFLRSIGPQPGAEPAAR